MDGGGGEPQAGCSRSSYRLPLWIIEHVWAHRMMDIQQVVDASSSWPDLDSQPLSLEDSWGLRVTSAQVYFIMKSRDVARFEKVIRFLEATYSLLPRLVPAIKHMKIMFGLKTMVIMWMFRAGRGKVETVSKIIQFFPNKLLQYQDQCSQREMFLMRKNHADFKDLAQSLALNKDRLQDYIQNQMEEQYGGSYAQKVEDRLLYYLQELEAALPGDTYIDKIMKKQSPVTEEERLLLDIITSDCTTIATTLTKLLHCDVTSCRPARIPQPPEHGEKRVEIPELSTSVLGEKTSLEIQPADFRGDQEAGQDISKDSPLLSENDSAVRGNQLPDEGGEVVLENKKKEDVSQRSSGCVQVSSPHFCSRHQRWVKTILQECPDDCSKTNFSSSPLLFTSSTSASSSQDLTPSDLTPSDSTPSDLVPGPLDRLPSQTTTQTSEPENPKVKLISVSSTQMAPLPQPSLSRNTLLPAVLSPVVRLVNITSSPAFKLCQVSSNRFIISDNNQGNLTSSPSPPLGNKDSMFVPSETCVNMKTAPETQHESTSTSSQPSTRHTFSKLSRKFRLSVRHSQAMEWKPSAELDPRMSCPPLSSVSGPPSPHASASTSLSICSANQIPSSARSSQQVVHQKAIKCCRQTHNKFVKPKTLPYSTVISSNSISSCLGLRSETGRACRARLRLSLPGQAALLQSKLLQPYVSLTRLSAEEYHRASASRGHEEPKEEEENADSSFDLNDLFSDSSDSDDEDMQDNDPDYKPQIKKKRLVLEYENQRVLKS